MALSARSRLGPYEILSPLGAGGMGEVYRARDTRLGRIVAIKILPERFAADPDLRLRFEREAKAAAALSHPHICAIFDVGVERGLQFIVMEHLDGETLADRMARGLLPLESSVEYGSQIADALSDAHRQGVIHRDLKPANVMLVRSGVKLLDFGVAKFRASPLGDDSSDSTKLPATAHGVLLGTLQYMAPEQLDGRDVDTRADLFSLGVLLYEMVTGIAPFAADSKAAVIAAILDREPPPASSFNAHLPSALDRLIAECLEKQRLHRPTADDLVRRLRGINVSQDTRPTSPHGQSRSRVVRSLAVLPFAATLSREGGDVFGDGLAEGLIASLGSFASLRVISPASGRRYRGSDKTAPEIGTALRVDAVLRGSVVERPTGLLGLNVELLETTKGDCIWSGQFECERADVLNIEEQIAHAVAAHIRLSTRERTPRRRRLNTESHEAYLRGKFQFDNSLGNWFESSFDALSASIKHDRTFAPAHAALSRWYMVAAVRQSAGADMSPFKGEWRDGCRKAEDEARLALRLDPLLADAHTALARVLYYRWKFDEAEQAYRKSLELDANNAVTHASYSNFLIITHCHDAAIKHAEIARDNDPLATYVHEQLAITLYSAGRFNECLDACRAGLELSPDAAAFHYFRGLALGSSGHFDEAAKSLTIACAHISDSRQLLCSLAAVFIRAGLGEAGSRLLDELQRDNCHPSGLAEIYMAMGQHNDALSQFERAFELESPQILVMFIDPAFAPLYAHPRFKRLVNGLGLIRFFESFRAAL